VVGFRQLVWRNMLGSASLFGEIGWGFASWFGDTVLLLFCSFDWRHRGSGVGLQCAQCREDRGPGHSAYFASMVGEICNAYHHCYWRNRCDLNMSFVFLVLLARLKFLETPFLKFLNYLFLVFYLLSNYLFVRRKFECIIIFS